MTTHPAHRHDDDAQNPQATALEARLSRLEGQNKLLRRGLGLAALLGGAVLLMGQAATPQTVSAQQFLLVDASGKRRAELSMAGEASRLLLFDKSKKVRLNFTVQHTGQPAVIFYDALQRPRSMLSTKADGSQAWVLFDAKQRPRATMATRKDGSPILFFTDDKGKITKMLPK